jgi:hypothetical protein
MMDGCACCAEFDGVGLWTNCWTLNEFGGPGRRRIGLIDAEENNIRYDRIGM